MAEVDEAENGLDDPVASLLAGVFVQRLRRRYGLERAAELVGLTAKTLQRYGKGEATPPPKTLARLAQQAGFSPPMLERLQGHLKAHRLAEAGELAGEPGSPRRPFSTKVAAVALEAAEEAAAVLVVEPALAPWEQTGKPRPEDRGRAAELWQRFLGQDPAERHCLVRESSAFHLWSFAERLANESEAAAAHSPADALELARLAVDVARKIQGIPSWCARSEAYSLLYLGNSLRVCNDLVQARIAFGKARKLQAAFSPNDPPLLDESRLPDLEASLRREERRFPEALALLEEALALAPLGRKVPILLNKAATLEQMSAYERALGALEEAEPYVLVSGTPRDLFALRFNTALCECHLARAGRAVELLPEIQSLAEKLGKSLDQLRTRWLTARVAAGLGRTEEAIVLLDRVCDDFLRTDPPLPIDAALAGLDLALYWLERGDTAAVKKLAVPLERVFTAKGIRREALGALRLFCEAARREAATLEMAKKAKAELERRPG
jgi:tetratricopeptide (TPR) repeat protein